MTPIQALTLLGNIAEEVRLEYEASKGDTGGVGGAVGGRKWGAKVSDEDAQKMFDEG